MSEQFFLYGSRCKNCHGIFLVERQTCPRCGNIGFDSTRLRGEGKIYSYTFVRVPPKGFEGKYCIALVDLDDSARVVARIISEDESKVRIGARVTFERSDSAGYWFKLQ